MSVARIVAMSASGLAFVALLTFWSWACFKFMVYTDGLPATSRQQASMLKIILNYKILGLVTASAGALFAAVPK